MATFKTKKQTCFPLTHLEVSYEAPLKENTHLKQSYLRC